METDSWTIKDYLAVYAAVLSTIVFLWNLIQSRPRIKVDLVYSIEKIDGNVQSGVSICIRNLSAHEVHLSGIDIVYPYRDVSLKDRLAFIWKFKRLPIRVGWCHSSLSNFSVVSGFPVCLEARNSHRVFISDSVVEEMLVGANRRCLIACVSDQLWTSFYSKEFQFGIRRHFLRPD